MLRCNILFQGPQLSKSCFETKGWLPPSHGFQPRSFSFKDKIVWVGVRQRIALRPIGSSTVADIPRIEKPVSLLEAFSVATSK
jgi:hypothetical protein